MKRSIPTEEILQTYKTPVELNWYAYISTYYGYSVNNGTGQTQLHRGVND